MIVASDQRWAKIREFEQPVDLDAHLLLAEIVEPGDRDLWVVVEGFRHLDHLKLEFWDPADERYPMYPSDPYIAAIITGHASALPEPTLLPTFGRDQITELVEFLIANAHRFDYTSPYDPGV